MLLGGPGSNSEKLQSMSFSGFDEGEQYALV